MIAPDTQAVKEYLLSLQDAICMALEKEDGVMESLFMMIGSGLMMMAHFWVEVAVPA